MKACDLPGLITYVKEGALSRRAFVRRLVAVGLSAPIAGQMLAWHGVAIAQATSTYKPTVAGGGGPLKILLWQAPTLLNPHFASGTKDQEASRVFYEPLAGWNDDGTLVPFLADEIPSRENGGLAADGRSVTWKLKRGVTWHDGAPFTADDVIFTAQYSAEPAAATYTQTTYKDLKVEKIDDFTVKVTFRNPTPFWADAFVGAGGMILPRHVFSDYVGARSREAPANLKPIGTGPYEFVDFKPGDILSAKRYANYHVRSMPHFDSIELKGGGDATSAARAVLQTAEFDFALNLVVEDEVLKRMEASGRGKVYPIASGNIEFIMLNTTDPWTEVDGERSSIETRHPTLTDPIVRQAINLLIDRASIQKYIYGRGGAATASFVNAPAEFKSKKLRYDFDIDKANKLLDEAGYVRGADGIREKDGKKLKYVFQTSINAPRQKVQAIIKQACQRAGIGIEIRAITASVFFSSDVANPETFTKFYADMEMYSMSMTQPDPGLLLQQFVSWEIATKDNKWLGRNVSRYRSSEADDAFRAAQTELDPVKRAGYFIRMDEIFCEAHIVLPLLSKTRVVAAVSPLNIISSGWDNDLYEIRAWFKQ